MTDQIETKTIEVHMSCECIVVLYLLSTDIFPAIFIVYYDV